jgi:HemK-related putative methylase
MEPRSSIATKLRRSCRLLFHIPYRPYAMARLHSPEDVLLLGRRFRTDAKVFNPGCFYSTEIFIRGVLELPLKGRRVLDMGAGSGAVGIFAAAAGADVVACDINPRAVAIARENAALNSVQVDVRESDLFQALAGEKFDHILFNIPYYPKRATNHYEMAFNAGEDFEAVRRFASDAAGHLASDGNVMVIFSEDSGYETISRIFAEAGFGLERSTAAYKHFEKFFIVTFALHRVR